MDEWARQACWMTVLMLALACVAYLTLKYDGEPPNTGQPPNAPTARSAERVTSPKETPEPVPTAQPSNSALSQDEALASEDETTQIIPIESSSKRPQGSARIEGVVVDKYGAPLPNMYVSMAMLLDEMVPGVFPWTPTDIEGRFSAENLVAGSYKLMALPVGSTVFNIDSGSREFALREGQALTDVRIVYEGISERTISGRVTNPAGDPVEGASVLGDEFFTRQATTKTDAYGNYVLDFVSNANCRVSVTHEDYSVQEAEGVKSGVRNLDFVLLSRGVIEGQVLDASTGQPLTEFEVGHRLQSARDPSVGYVTVSDRDGHFVLDNIDVGTLNVYVRAKGYAPGWVESIQVNPDEVTGGVVLRLNHGATIHGRVVSTEGAPVSGAQLRLERPRDREVLPPGLLSEYESIVQSGEDGHFTLENLQTGFTHLTAVHSDYSDITVPFSIAEGQTTSVDIVMTGLAVVEGTLYANGEPAAGQNVEIHAQSYTVSLSGNYSGKTDENGYYRIADVPAAKITVHASVNVGGSRRVVTADAQTAPGHTTEVDLEAQFGTSSIEGSVTWGGEVIANMPISAIASESKDHASSHITSDGNYRIDGLYGGEYRLYIVDTRTGEPKVLGSAQVSVEEGKTAVVDIETIGDADENTETGAPSDAE